MKRTPAALEGIRVLDFSHALAGPYCTLRGRITGRKSTNWMPVPAIWTASAAHFEDVARPGMPAPAPGEHMRSTLRELVGVEDAGLDALAAPGLTCPGAL